MECLGVEPGAAWRKAQTNPLSYGGTPIVFNVMYLQEHSASLSSLLNDKALV